MKLDKLITKYIQKDKICTNNKTILGGKKGKNRLYQNILCWLTEFKIKKRKEKNTQKLQLKWCATGPRNMEKAQCSGTENPETATCNHGNFEYDKSSISSHWGEDGLYNSGQHVTLWKKKIRFLTHTIYENKFQRD